MWYMRMSVGFHVLLEGSCEKLRILLNAVSCPYTKNLPQIIGRDFFCLWILIFGQLLDSPLRKKVR
jgi:hypothetical protein